MSVQTKLKNYSELNVQAPAIFAEAPAAHVSKNYKFVPTYKVLEMFADQGWEPYSANQVKGRTVDADMTAKHVVRMRHRDLTLKEVGDTIPELVCVNAHNWQSGYKLLSGLFRLVCSNGMIVQDASFGEPVHLRHEGVTGEVVYNLSQKFCKESMKNVEEVFRWKTIDLSKDQKQDFAQKATALRWEAVPKEFTNELLRVRRPQDKGEDLWSTFNVVQENLIRGGWYNSDTHRMVRPIMNITKDIDINSNLWQLASGYVPDFWNN